MYLAPTSIVRTCFLSLAAALMGSAAPASDWWDITTVDSAAGVSVGANSSLTLLASGQPAISYAQTMVILKYAWFDGAAWHTAVVNPTGRPEWTSVAGLPNSQAAIGYTRLMNQAVYYTWQDEIGWHESLVEGAYNGHFYFPSLAVLPSGQPALCYWSGGALRYAVFDGSVWQIQTVGSGSAGLFSNMSLRILPSGYPAIAYYQPYGYWEGRLIYVAYDGQAWQQTIIDEQPGIGVGLTDSLALLPSGEPAIGYQTVDVSPEAFTVKYAWRDGSTWHTMLVDDTGLPGTYLGLALLPGGRPAIAYGNQSPAGNFIELRFAELDGETWRRTVIARGDVGQYASLVTLPTGQPAVSYYEGDPNGGVLKYAVRRAVSGDVNCDGRIDFGDIDAFVVALTGEAAYQAAYPDCHWLLADIDDDGQVDAADINPFVALLAG